MHILNIVLFSVGWILFVAGQAQNSITSKTNGLPTGWPGIKIWLRAHAVDLARRAFFSGLAYGFLIQTVSSKLQSIGFAISAHAIAGVSGFSANNLLYQFFGLFPGLRVEVADLAPPPNSQVVVTQQPPSNPSGVQP